MSRRVHILVGTDSDGVKLFTCGRKVRGPARCIGRALVVDAATRREVTCALCLERLPFRSGSTEPAMPDAKKQRRAHLIDRAKESVRWAGEAHKLGDPGAFLDMCNALGDILHILEDDQDATPDRGADQ